ncbi:calcium-binding protein [Acuticoccus kandeliae]|uniref:calcium-binding protein n=1 Tax=Acuticoccus kandeliae TaxID=2073160 RepID=UPI000D3E612A|nr:hypothetical protein [Acuticoccus kandeliae]
MGIFDFQDLTKEDIFTFVELAQAAYEPNRLPGVSGDAPAGWQTLTGADLNYTGSISDGFFVGNYFVGGIDSYFAAAARVMVKDGVLTVSFQGTESLWETLLYTEIANSDEYIANFDALMEAVADYIAIPENGIEEVWITGHSLGASAVNELEDVAETRYDGAFEDAVYVSFATPEIFEDDANILNIGYENDDVFKSVEDDHDFPTTTNNIVYYNLDFLLPEPSSGSTIEEIADVALNLLMTHNIPNYIDGISRILASEFYDEMDRQSFVVVDDYAGTVNASRIPTHAGEAGYYIGSDDNDRMFAGSNNDSLEGFSGNDVLRGVNGDDVILGGEGNDRLFGQAGDDEINGGEGDDFINGGPDEDTIVFDFANPIGNDTVIFNPFEDTIVFVNSTFTEQELEDAYESFIARGVFDFGADGSITLIGAGINVAFDPGDVVLV